MTRTGSNVVPMKAVVHYLIGKCPGRIELELTRPIWGRGALSSRVNRVCRDLVNEGSLACRGTGNRGSPCRYWPAQE